MVKNAQVLQTAGIYTPPLNSHYTQINTSPVSDDVMRISIGQGGRVFKAITHQSNVNYIWFNKEKTTQLFSYKNKFSDPELITFH